ncbi:MAG: hypothetical protein JHC25_01410 [Thermodesulfobacterium sp.]|nr:hypothetical protein [Thermodesulfobacterium sp.]
MIERTFEKPSLGILEKGFDPSLGMVERVFAPSLEKFERSFEGTSLWMLEASFEASVVVWVVVVFGFGRLAVA